MKPRLVLLGFLSHFPVAGVAWQTVHYLVGFQRLGFDVYYVEAHGCTPTKLMRGDDDDGTIRAAEYIHSILSRFGMGDRWAYHAIYESRCLGLSESKLRELYREAALIINLHGSHLPTEELTATGRLVFLETDPVDLQIDIENGKREAIDYVAPHVACFTFGENLGAPDCRVPVSPRFKFHPTRQPVVMDFWEQAAGPEARPFTTIGNWRQPWREVQFRGEVYRWSKHFEFLKFIDLPRRLPAQPFELALSSFDDNDRRLLESHGWQVRNGLDVSQDMDVYRRYIQDSRGEFTVAKDQNIRLRSGWFSDRAVTYLAAGRPVVTQETAFSNILPTGAGLFGFSTMPELTGAIEAIHADYARHSRAAWQIARECFSHDVVLGNLLRVLGVSAAAVPGAPGFSADPGAGGQPGENLLPDDLVLLPVSRWPTRLPERTLTVAMSLPVPVAGAAPVRPAASPGSNTGRRASVVMVTHNGLPYTRLCLASLLGKGWRTGDELIIVDNASTDGTREFLGSVQRQNPFVKLILNERNLGFATANNLGLAVASGGVLVLLNNDTLTPAGWLDGLVRWLDDPTIGMVGPVTNRTCNEAQIDAGYRTFGQLGTFSAEYTGSRAGLGGEIAMLAMYCLAIRRDVLQRVGPLDEQFEIGMFEDDDYARRVRAAGFRIVCAEDVFVHHFGQGSFGELCLTGDYDRVFESNRRRFEAKWGTPWQPHRRRITPEYRELRRRIHAAVVAAVPTGAHVTIISKGDEELVALGGHQASHFPQGEGGGYANVYPADCTEAIAHLESLVAKGCGYLVIPKPAFWWLEHYGQFKAYLEERFSLILRDEDSCLIFNVGGGHG